MTATRINPGITVETFTKAYTVAANSGSAAIDITCSKAGYTLLGAVGFGTGASDCMAYQCRQVGANNIRMYVHNYASASRSPTAYVHALFLRTA